MHTECKGSKTWARTGQLHLACISMKKSREEADGESVCYLELVPMAD